MVRQVASCQMLAALRRIISERDDVELVAINDPFIEGAHPVTPVQRWQLFALLIVSAIQQLHSTWDAQMS